MLLSCDYVGMEWDDELLLEEEGISKHNPSLKDTPELDNDSA